MNDISRDFKPTKKDQELIGIIASVKGNVAIKHFMDNKDDLSDYAYWFALSTLWVNNTDGTDLETWRELFSSNRPRKRTSLMKPSELIAYKTLPSIVTAFRAHKDEKDWIAYTINLNIAIKFAKIKKAETINGYKIQRKNILALFLRRDEAEIICLDKTKTKEIGSVNIKHTVGG